MENAVLIYAEGTAQAITIEGFEDESLAEALGAAEAKRCWSHKLIAFGSRCHVAMMAYADPQAQEKGQPLNEKAAEIIGEPVYGKLLLVYWDNMRMSWGAMEPHEVEHALAEING